METKKRIIRSLYDQTHYKLCQTEVGKESLTKQSDKDKCDINKIIAKYEKTGMLPINKNQALYADFSELPDYNEALNIVIKAEQQFMELPASIRDKFNNSPEQMLEFMSDEKNYDEAVSLGLALPKEKISAHVSSQGEGAGEAVSEPKGEAALSGDQK